MEFTFYWESSSCHPSFLPVSKRQTHHTNLERRKEEKIYSQLVSTFVILSSQGSQHLVIFMKRPLG